jgi:hypothetical protein
MGIDIPKPDSPVEFTAEHTEEKKLATDEHR